VLSWKGPAIDWRESCRRRRRGGLLGTPTPALHRAQVAPLILRSGELAPSCLCSRSRCSYSSTLSRATRESGSGGADLLKADIFPYKYDFLRSCLVSKRYKINCNLFKAKTEMHGRASAWLPSISPFEEVKNGDWKALFCISAGIIYTETLYI
jgi:hypothetical protein